MAGMRLKSRLLQLKIRPYGILTAAGVLIGIATLAGFLGRLWWVLDLFSHFRVQYAILLFFIAVTLLMLHRIRIASAFLALAAVNLIVIAPFYLGKVASDRDESRQYRAVLINVYTPNQDYYRVVSLIEQYEPDFFVLLEVNNQWLEGIRKLEAAYPYAETNPRPDNFGIALYSKQPFAKSDTVYIGAAMVPSVCAQFDLDGRRLTVLGTHTVPPARREGSYLRNEQLARISAFLEQYQGPVIVLGDLNMTPWSHYFRKLLRDAGLKDGSRGHGIAATWPTNSLLLRIPIDHFLHSPDLMVLSKKKGHYIGSDHYPIIVDFAFAEK
jgi:endonuclease/exonuclease/phosphatase (EEP) superfamily protein YafD